MHVKYGVFALLASSLVAVSGCETNEPANTNTPISDATIAQSFPKSTSVFGVRIFGSANTPDATMLHAANIMAEYLDNNEDGTADNMAVVNRLVRDKASLMMAADSDELERLFRTVFGTQQNAEQNDVFQDLLADEVHPNGAARGVFDASLEEVLHLITHVGYARVYPGVFGEQAGSAIADAMDAARGGRFTQVPSTYSPGAWYTYDDTTCTYDCMVTEYTYWALTSILGAQSFTGRLAQIQDEWQLNTAALVRSRDAAVNTLLTDAQYALPTVLPNGNYSAKTFTITRTQKP